jgi:hypothetical protein
MMKRFGPRPVSMTSQVSWMAVPVGKSCAWCEEVFDASDPGFAIPYLGYPGDPPELLYHEACLLRHMFGCIAHQVRVRDGHVCDRRCFDPPDLTTRQAAEAAAAEFLRWHSQQVQRAFDRGSKK